MQYFIKVSYERMNIVNKKSCAKIDKEDLKILNNRYKEMDEKLDFTASAYMKIYNLYDYDEINKDWIIRYVAGLYFILEQQKLDLDNIADNKLLTKKEIIELMYICYCRKEEDFYDDEKLSLWLIAAGQISYLAKAYNEAKKIIDENDNEDLINELRIEKDKCNDIRNKLIDQGTKLCNFEEENKKLYKENERLKLELEELKNIKKEVVSLRDYIFTKENREQFKEDEISKNDMINYLNKIDGIIVGGCPTWKNKIMQTINWEHIPVEALNFDARILKDKFVVVNTSYMNHGIYYKLISKISEIKELKFINNVTNIDRSLSEIYKAAQ